MAWLSRLLAAREGSIAIMGALALTSVIGMSGMAVEVGQGYVQKIANQRAADTAALAAGIAYSNGGTLAAATQVAKDVVAASGVASNATVTVTPDLPVLPTQIQVAVASPMSIALLKVLGGATSLTTHNSATASLISNQVAACILALSTSVTYGVSLNGGTTLTALGCSVTANQGVSVPAGTHVTTKQVNAGTSVWDQAAGWLIPGVITLPVLNNVRQNLGKPAVDYVRSDPRVIAGFNKIGNYTTPQTNADPVTPTGANWTFPDSGYAFGLLPATDPVKANCALVLSLYTCKGGTYAIGTMRVPGGMSVTFLGTVNATFSGGINNGNGGGRLTFVGGTFAVNGAVNTGSGGITFGDGTFAFGSAGVTVGSGGLSIGNGALTMNTALNMSGGGITTTIGAGDHSFNAIALGGGCTLTIGSGSLNVANAITLGGGSKMTVGAGAVTIGNNGSGTAIYVDGSSVLTFGDGAFSANGKVATSGGSALTIGAATSHYINGNLDLNGSAVFGAGGYYVNGNFTNNTGGVMTGLFVTFFLKGSLTASGGTALVMAAPISDAGGGVTELVFATKSTAATTLGGGTQDVYDGLIYTPYSDLAMTGGAGVRSGGLCMELIANTVTMSGGAAAATICPTLGASGTTGSVRLLQ